MNRDSAGISKSVRVVNVVATGELSGMVNLEYLYAAADEEYVQYDPVHHQGCYLRFLGEDGPLITVYNSGKYIIRANSIEEVYNQDQKLMYYLREIGVPPEVKQISFELNNIVGKSDLGREIDLEPLAEDLSYADPSDGLAPGRLSFQYPDSNSTISIFRTGTAVIMGAKSAEEINQVWSKFREDLEELFEKEKDERSKRD